MKHDDAVIQRETAIAGFFEALTQLIIVATHALKDEIKRKTSNGGPIARHM